MGCILIFTAVGCKPGHPPLGTLVPMSQVISEYNSNAAKVPRLWARANISMTYREKPGDLGFSWGSTIGDPNGLLLLNKTANADRPQDFMLQIKELGNRIGQLGTSTVDGAYYFWLNFGDTQNCSWGQLKFAGAPGITGMPIDPTQLLAVLGVCELPADQTRPPFLGQTICFDPPAYILTFVDRQPVTKQLKFRREVYFRWSETKARRPFMVKIFNDLGLVVLTAEMKNYREISQEDSDGNEGDAKPLMPTDIKLTWHETGSELHLVLAEMTTAEKFDPDAFLLYYAIPWPLPSIAKQVDMDVDGPRPLPLSQPKNGDETE